MRFAFLFIFLLLILPLVSAVPPVTQNQQFTTGYIVQIPQDNIFQINQKYNFEFHVSNISDGVPIHKGISCYLHIYNETGEHVYVGSDGTSSDPDLDYSFAINNKNFTTVGAYYYFVNCNSSNLGGFSESIIRVYLTGDEVPIGFYVLLFIIVYGILAFGISREDITLTILGSFALSAFSLYIFANGIYIYKSWFTDMLGIINLGVAFYVGLRAGLESVGEWNRV